MILRTTRSRAVLAGLLGLVLAEVALRWSIGADGTFLGHPLPPYGALTNANQRAWLDLQRKVLAGEAPRPGPSVFDRELGWTNLPDESNAERTIVTNSIGARGQREYAATRPIDTLRLGCFGDSFTWCDEVEDRATWPAQLEALAPAVEAINFGLPAYGTDQALLRFRRDGGALGIDVVCIGLLVENIGRNVNRYRPLWFPRSGSAAAKPRFAIEDGALQLVPHGFASHEELIAAIEDGSVHTRLAPYEYWRERPDLGILRHCAIARIAGAWIADREREVRSLWLDRTGEPYRTTLAVLETFDREARASGAKHALVLVFPRLPDLEMLLTQEDRFWSGLLADLRERSIAVLDLSEPLASAARRESAEALYRGGHLNRAGNAVVARAVHDWLSAEGLAATR